ncbi:MAG: SRPBCC domain-containing protein [Candidatus Dormibacteria bacterium]
MTSTLGRAWDALADPGRRAVLEQLAQRPGTVGQLAARLAAPAPVLAELVETLMGAGLLATDRGVDPPTLRVSTRGVEELRDYLGRIADMAKLQGSAVPTSQPPAGPVAAEARFSVSREVQIRRNQAQAFRLFTEGMGDWWPLGRRHFGRAPAVTVIVEPQAGGRWYERGDDGSESAWGETLLWEPPQRLVLGWRVGPAWTHDPAARTEVDVAFISEGPSACRVRMEHRCLDLSGPEAAGLQATFDAEDGWTELLRRFAEAS